MQTGSGAAAIGSAVASATITDSLASFLSMLSVLPGSAEAVSVGALATGAGVGGGLATEACVSTGGVIGVLGMSITGTATIKLGVFSHPSNGVWVYVVYLPE